MASEEQASAEVPQTLEGWYVLHDFVTLDIPDKTEPEHAVLRIACNRADNRLTAGCDTVLELDLTYGDELRTIIGQFFGPENVPPEGPINVVLGGQEWTVDHSLHGELLGNLLVWQVEVELGDLLVQYDLSLAQLATIDIEPYGNPRVVGLEINAAGEILALVDDGRILVFDPASGALLRTITLERLGEASNLEIASDGSLLVSHMMPIASVLDIPTLDPLGLALLAVALAALAAFFLARRRARA